MTRSPAVPWSTWWLEPRDPLVFGDGARVPALVPRHTGWLPPQPSLAGFVRSRFVAGAATVSAEVARGLLDISLRGPWLVSGGELRSREDTLWLPVPADAALGASTSCWHRRAPLELEDAEGVNWTADAPPDLLPMTLPSNAGHEKVRLPRFPFWPFEDVLSWSLEERPPVADEPVTRGLPVPEYRIHVQLDDDIGTAAPEALFSSGGMRYPERFRIAVEVRDDRPSAPEGSSSDIGPPVMALLGAESRASRLTVARGPCFPLFETVRERFGDAVERLLAAGRPLALRLQLLTPGCFGGWQPRWPQDLGLPLRSVALPPFTAVSGWNLQRRGPRAVRRLVPPGALYVLGPVASAPRLLELCESFWGRSLCEGYDGDPAAHLAPPVRDGYGIVLPSPSSVGGHSREGS